MLFVALTAWQALVERANLQPGPEGAGPRRLRGRRRLRDPAGQDLGATITTTTGTSNVEWVRDLGADVVIDYRTQDLGNGRPRLRHRPGLPGRRHLAVAPGPEARRDGHRHRRPADPAFARQKGLRLPLRLAMTALEPEDPPSGPPPRRALLVPVHARQRCPTRPDHQAHRDQRPPTHPRPGVPFDEAPKPLAHVEGGRTKGKVVITMV